MFNERNVPWIEGESQVKGNKTTKKKAFAPTRERGFDYRLCTNAAGGFAVTLVRNETQRNSAALKKAGQDPICLLLLY